MVHLDDLDVVGGTELPCGGLDERKEHIDADTHVRREDDGDLPCVSGELGLLRLGEARRAYDGTGTVPRAQREMGERSLRAGEIDQHVGHSRRGIDIGVDRHAGRTSEPLAGITADESALRDVEGGNERATGIGKDGFDQRLAHLPARARDGDPHRLRHFFLKMSRNCSHQERGSDHAPSPAVIAAADLLSSAIEIGISSPSHRASLSSTK